MKAFLLDGVKNLKTEKNPLKLTDYPEPVPAKNEVLIKVSACAVCHTELDEIEGRTPPPEYPVIPGHQIVGRVIERGRMVTQVETGSRVGVGWIYDACGDCSFCRNNLENLCPQFLATGRDRDGGYAEYLTCPETSVFPIPERYSDGEAAPLFCAGAVGYRSLKLTGFHDGQTLGLTGFGASGHLVLKMARFLYPNSPVFVFARSELERQFATQLGAAWTGDIPESSPQLCDAIIDTTPVWRPVVEALRNLNSNGRLVINAIRKENHDRASLLNLSYADHLWLEKTIKSVANVTRSNISEFLDLAEKIPIIPEYELIDFREANQALMTVKMGGNRGAKVLNFQ